MKGQTQNIVLILMIMGAIYLIWNNKDDLQNKLEDFEKKQKQAIRDELDKRDEIDKQNQLDKRKEQQMRSDALAIEDDIKPIPRQKKRYKINMNVHKNILEKQHTKPQLKHNKPNQKLRKYKMAKPKQIQQNLIKPKKKLTPQLKGDDLLNDVAIDVDDDYHVNCNEKKHIYNDQTTEQNITSYVKPDTDGGNVRGQALVGMMHFLNGMKTNKKDKPLDMNDPKMQQLVNSDQFKELLARKNEIDFENDLKTALNMKISSKNMYYMDIHSDINFNGRIVIELFADIVPKTCRNFKKLITQQPPKKSYIGCPFHKFIKNFVMVGGDITNHDGSGGKSIYGPTFRDENFTLKHNQEGIISMANNGVDTNNSQFFIILREDGAPWLDNKHVVFGIIINGLDYLTELGNKISIDDNDKPVECVWIDDCGEVDIENGEECYDDISSISTSALSAM
jgi:cyclophilin family peptidyl-prolyl cis-trans isomerase